MKEKDIEYRFHQISIPTHIIRPNEKYNEKFKIFTSYNNGDFRVQFYRFEKDCPLHPIIINNPHIALQVSDLTKALVGKEILLGPYELIKGVNAAIYNDNGCPIELFETDLEIGKLWDINNQQKDLDIKRLKQIYEKTDNCKIIIDLFKNIFEKNIFDEKYLRKAFTKDFVQYSNGKKLSLEEFVRRIKSVKSKAHYIKFEFNNVINSGETIFSNHTIYAEMKNGKKNVYQVMSEMKLREGKLYYCNDLSRFIEP